MSDQRNKTLYRYKSSDMNSSTIETYVHSISDNSSEKLYPNELQEDLDRYTTKSSNGSNYIDLVHIPNHSQKKYCDYVEASSTGSYPTSLDSKYYYPEGYTETKLIRPFPGKCYIRDYTTPTIVIDSQPPIQQETTPLISSMPSSTVPTVPAVVVDQVVDVSEPVSDSDNPDGLLLDRISLDLDYLLNRGDCEIPVTAPPPAPVIRKSSLKSPVGILKNSHIGQIREEDETESVVDEEESIVILPKESSADEEQEAKTVC